jgi:GT2 family glycosyltransferase/glycosyltransferase involved in cell wall biosynthesis
MTLHQLTSQLNRAIRYRIPSGVQMEYLFGRMTLSTPEGGRVAIDQLLYQLWQFADQKSLGEIVEADLIPYAKPENLAAGLACLAEAGLLQRADQTPESGSHPQIPSELRLVSVVIVTYKSRAWLEICIPSLLAQTYPAIEIIVVENGSGDDTLPWLAENYPEVRQLDIPDPVPLAAALNRGVDLTRGEYLLLLNPDVKLDPEAIAQMVQCADDAANADADCAAVAAKLKLMYTPAFLNGIGNRVGPFSFGMDNALGHLDLGQFDHWQELPSVCFAAALIPRTTWEKVGCLDEDLPMYYEDTEWSYRARLLGWKILAVPEAVIEHAFGRLPGELDEVLSAGKLANVVYGRYYFAGKIVGDRLPLFLLLYGLEDFTNLVRLAITGKFNMAKAYLTGWRQILAQWPRLRSARQKLQQQRVITDRALFALQRDIPTTLIWRGMPELTWDLVIHHYEPLIRNRARRDLQEFMNNQNRKRFLIVSHEVIDAKMAGPGVRYVEMARALSDSLEVTLATPNETGLQIPGVRITHYDPLRPKSLQVLVDACDIALISGNMVERFPFLQTTPARLVVDWYDPIVFENLHYYLDEALPAQQSINQHTIDIINQLARVGDYFICGNERQRDLWLGVLASNGRVNPLNFDRDQTLRGLIDVVGIGLPESEAEVKPYLKGSHPQIPVEARLVLWGGGIWDWLDPLTLVRAWPAVIAQEPRARLVFLGTRHPNPLVPQHEMARKTLALAEEIGEKDKSIIFIDWLAYDQRESLLTEADVGIALHPVHIETRYSIRTRVLDYIWTRLPIVITAGDITSEWVRQYRLGEVVPEQDDTAVSEAILRILAQPKSAWADAFTSLIEQYRWSRVVQPLEAYCLHGLYAPDRIDRRAGKNISNTASLPNLLARARYIWRTEGTRMLLHRLWRYIQWRLARF